MSRCPALLLPQRCHTGPLGPGPEHLAPLRRAPSHEEPTLGLGPAEEGALLSPSSSLHLSTTWQT